MQRMPGYTACTAPDLMGSSSVQPMTCMLLGLVLPPSFPAASSIQTVMPTSVATQTKAAAWPSVASSSLIFISSERLLLIAISSDNHLLLKIGQQKCSAAHALRIQVLAGELMACNEQDLDREQLKSSLSVWLLPATIPRSCSHTNKSQLRGVLIARPSFAVTCSPCACHYPTVPVHKGRWAQASSPSSLRTFGLNQEPTSPGGQHRQHFSQR